jgi:hypothetical protein
LRFQLIHFQPKVVEKLRRRWAVRVHVPGFIKLGVMALFHKTRIQVEISDIVIGCRKTKEDPREVVTVEFAASVSAAFDAHA